jgi:hypothetical protein
MSNTVEQGTDRAIKTNFSMTLSGYLVADTINKEMANADMFYSPSQLIFGLETTEDLTDLSPATQMAANNTVGSTSFIGDGNQITNIVLVGAALLDLSYLNTNKPLKADTITTPDKATFTGAVLLQPSVDSALPRTTVSNFILYVNGQYVPTSFV